MTEKEKRRAIIIVIIVIIILLLLFFLKKARRVIPVYDDTNLRYGLPNMNLDLGDLIIPDLSFFQGVNSCGCGEGHTPPTMPNKPIAPKADEPYRSIQYQTPKPQSKIMFAAVASPNSRIGTWDASGRYADGSISKYWP